MRSCCALLSGLLSYLYKSPPVPVPVHQSPFQIFVTSPRAAMVFATAYPSGDQVEPEHQSTPNDPVNSELAPPFAGGNWVVDESLDDVGFFDLRLVHPQTDPAMTQLATPFDEIEAILQGIAGHEPTSAFVPPGPQIMFDVVRQKDLTPEQVESLPQHFARLVTSTSQCTVNKIDDSGIPLAIRFTEFPSEIDETDPPRARGDGTTVPAEERTRTNTVPKRYLPNSTTIK
jgi:hypothetical protein